jgi:predicted dehydrogenase
VRLGVIGCGAIAVEAHLPAARNVTRVQLEAVVDKDPIQSRRIAHGFGAKYALERYEEVIGKVDAAIVATPNWTHAEITCFLLEHGVHVLCEKPLALTVADAERVFATSDRCKTRVMVGHSRRFTENAQALHTLVQLGSFGRVHQLVGGIGMPLERWPARESFRTDPRLSGGGCLMDSCIHLIDLALWLIGRCAVVREYVSSETRRLGVEDDATVTLGFSDGIIARLASSYTHELSFMLSLAGSDGWARMPINGKPGMEFLARTSVVGRSGGVQQLAIGGTSAYDEQLRHFCRCIETDEPFIVRSEEVLEGLRIVEECYHRELARDL